MELGWIQIRTLSTPMRKISPGVTLPVTKGRYVEEPEVAGVSDRARRCGVTVGLWSKGSAKRPQPDFSLHYSSAPPTQVARRLAYVCRSVT